MSIRYAIEHTLKSLVSHVFAPEPDSAHGLLTSPSSRYLFLKAHLLWVIPWHSEMNLITSPTLLWKH